MPVVAVIGGIASAAAGVSAFAAATTTLGSIAAGLSVVGGVASALGGLTGNKKLMKIGMVASLGGAAITGLSSLSTSASQAAGSATTLSSAGDGIGLTAEASASGLQPASALSEGLNVGAAAKSDFGALANLDTGVGRIASDAAQAIPSGVAPMAVDAATPSLLASDVAGGSLYALGQQSGGGLLSQMDTGVYGNALTPGISTGDAFSGASSALKNFGGILKSNPEMTKLGLGVMSAIGQSQMEKARQEEEYRIREEARKRYNNSITNQVQSF